ncbi:hypothetical protein [Novosphingobium sp.]|uniref:hypothetical protein n=1 Tax=Novosphingobium sp. TaxID=1874826 RepID=UPI003BAD1325
MTLVLIDNSGSTLVPRIPQGDANAEHPLRDLIFEHPAILPLAELEPEIGRVVAVAKEFYLPGAGFADVLLVSEWGRLIIVECKLWRNPQARREVVGQVLDYARQLARSDYETLQAAISSNRQRRGNVLYELAREAGSSMSEAQFYDRVARDLAAGRFLLLIAGDGITESARRLGEYLRDQPGLAFDLGLLEIADYRFSDPTTGEERRIVQPRLIARTQIIDRFVIRSEVPGITIATDDDPNIQVSARSPGSSSESVTAWRSFIADFVAEVRFDDPAQMPPTWGGPGWMKLPFLGPAKPRLYRSAKSGNVGVYLSYTDADGQEIYASLHEDREAIAAEFLAAGLSEPTWTNEDGTATFALATSFPQPWDAAREAEQRAWLASAANQMVNSLRPRIARLTA